MLMSRSREMMLTELNLAGKDCVEIGVYEGKFSKEILKQNPKHLTLIDPWCGQKFQIYPDDRCHVKDDKFESIYELVSTTFKDDKRVTILRDYSFYAAPKFVDKSIDFVYIDAIHTMESCFSDMCVWYHKVKDGGWLCGHDFTGWPNEPATYPGVKLAVEAFCRVSGKKIDLMTMDSFASWGIKKV